MPAFFTYITNITYYLLFAAVVGMLAPTGKYKKFVTLVTGFVLVVMVLAPVSRMGRDFNVADFFAGVAGLPSFQVDLLYGEYTTLHDRQLAAAFEQQLFFQLEVLLLRNGFTLHEAAFSHRSDFSRITFVRVEVSQNEAEVRRVPFIRIEPVQINRGPAATPEPDPLVTEIKNLIANFYNLEHRHIYVNIRKV